MEHVLTIGYLRARTVAIAAAVALLLSGAASAAANVATEPQYGGDYRAPLSVEPLTLDPARLTDIYSINVATNVFDGLLAFNQKLDVTAAIARRWKISRDHRTYTFQLRQGVTFHNGRERSR